MNFPDVKKWTIPEGSVERVRDSQDRIIWQKPYEIIDYVSTGANGAWGGVIVPINIPQNSTDFEIGFEYQSQDNYSVNLIEGQSSNDIAHTYSSNNATCQVGKYVKQMFTTWAMSNPASNAYTGTYPSNHNLFILNGSSTDKCVRWYYDLDSVPDSYSIGRQNTSIVSSSALTGYWGFGVIATGANTYDTDSNHTNWRFVGNIYHCYIKLNGDYVIDLKPALETKTGIYGLYDVVNEVFYRSCTGTDFTRTIVPATGITVYDGYVYVGKTGGPLYYKMTPANTSNKKVTWTSSDTSKATVDPTTGILTGVSYAAYTTSGNIFNPTVATDDRPSITATAIDGSGVTGSGKVEVRVYPESVTISPRYLSVAVGDTADINVTPTPSYATLDGNIRWRSDNTRYVTVENKTYSYSKKVVGRVTGVEDVYYAITVTCEFFNGTNWVTAGTCDVSVTDDTVDVTGVSLNKSTATIGSDGGQTTLVATVTPSNATNNAVVWSSSNPSIASVNANGVVTGLSPGTSTITVTTSDGGYTASCEVTVQAIAVTGVTLDPSAVMDIGAGDNVQFTATISPANASNTNLTITPSGGSVTSSSKNGNVWTINYVTAGSGSNTLTVTTADGGYSATSSMSVVQTIPVTGISIYPNSAQSMNAGATMQFYANITPSNATNQNKIWETTDSSIITVNQSGVVTAVGNGTAYVIARSSSGNYTDSCKITVTTLVSSITLDQHSLALNYNNTYQLTATINPSTASNKGVTWTSSNTDVATVNSSGKITAVGVGSATITCTAKDVSHASDTCDVTVSIPQTVGISPSSVSLSVGGTATVTATSSPNPTAGWWESSNINVATVSPGTPTTIPGTATITAVGTGTATVSFNQSSGTVVSCSVTVTGGSKTVSIYNPSSYTIHYGNDATTSNSAGSGETSVTINSGGSLYINKLGGASSDVTISSCQSTYSVVSDTYVFNYSNIVSNDTIILDVS